MSNKVNILTFKSNAGNKYIFDALTNNIYEVERDTELGAVKSTDLGHSNSLRDNALEAPKIESNILNNAKTLIIEITEQCNLRCTYCVFDEKNDIDRNHSSKSLPIDKALESVRNFSARTNQEEAYIVFYGGEPLMAFETIKKVVHYAKNINSNFKFSFTTNGYSLHKNLFPFLIENEFKITVSLDGDKNTHDKYRITKNGNGTFDTIIKNLEILRDYNEKFFNRNVLINCVIANSDDINEINSFFNSYNLPAEMLRFSPVIQDSSSITTDITNLIPLETINNIIPTVSGPIEKEMLDSVLNKIRYRKLDNEAPLGKKLCIPFANRTYTRTNGDVQFCERIGDFKRSEDQTSTLIENSIYVSQEFKKLKYEDCSQCFAYNFCEFCPASFIENSKFDEKLINNKCHNFRTLVKKAISIHIEEEEKA